MGCPKFTYPHLSVVPILQRLYNAADGEESRPYQLAGQTDFPATVDTALRTITYISGERPLTISKSGNTATFSYSHAGQRTKMALTGATNYTRTYLCGDFEQIDTGSGVVDWLYLGGTLYTAPVVANRVNGSWQFFYIHRDYLGSICAVNNS